MIASSVGRKHRYFQLLCTLTICRRYTSAVSDILSRYCISLSRLSLYVSWRQRFQSHSGVQKPLTLVVGVVDGVRVADEADAGPSVRGAPGP